MASSIAFYCGPKDLDAINAYMESIGLHLIPLQIGGVVALEPSEGPLCYISLNPIVELHPYGNPPINISYAKDPLILFMRGYFKNPYLVNGFIQCPDIDADFEKIARPHFQKIKKWIFKNWKQMPGGDFYIGNDGAHLVVAGAKMVNAIPGELDFKLIDIGD